MQQQEPIWVVGVGPGDPSYITQRVAELIAAANTVAGFAPPLETASAWVRGERMLLDYCNQEASLQTLAQRAARGERCVVCAQGDPNFSAGELVSRVRAVWPRVEVEPGISSIQVVCARAGMALEESFLVTFHKRGDSVADREALLREARIGQRHLIVLPRPWDFMPSAIAQFLLDGAVSPHRAANVYQRLTLPEESVTTLSLGELASTAIAFSDLSILVVPRVEEVP